MKDLTAGTVRAGHSGGADEAIVPNTAPLAERINGYHAAVTHHGEQMLLNARAAGELLLEAKNGVKHGEWLNWIAANFAGSEKTAHNYMRVARRWPQIEATAKPHRVADLSINEALKLARYGYSRKPYRNETNEGRA